jgi:hypothetical protein
MFWRFGDTRLQPNAKPANFLSSLFGEAHKGNGQACGTRHQGSLELPEKVKRHICRLFGAEEF